LAHRGSDVTKLSEKTMNPCTFLRVNSTLYQNPTYCFSVTMGQGEIITMEHRVGKSLSLDGWAVAACVQTPTGGTREETVLSFHH
jgi:hypothetical protein